MKYFVSRKSTVGFLVLLSFVYLGSVHTVSATDLILNQTIPDGVDPDDEDAVDLSFQNKKTKNYRLILDNIKKKLEFLSSNNKNANYKDLVKKIEEKTKSLENATIQYKKIAEKHKNGLRVTPANESNTVTNLLMNEEQELNDLIWRLEQIEKENISVAPVDAIKEHKMFDDIHYEALPPHTKSVPASASRFTVIDPDSSSHTIKLISDQAEEDFD